MYQADSFAPWAGLLVSRNGLHVRKHSGEGKLSSELFFPAGKVQNSCKLLPDVFDCHGEGV